MEMTKIGDYEMSSLATISPPLAPPAFERLKRNIAEYGQLEPIYCHAGLIIDGVNRLIACHELGITPNRFTAGRSLAGGAGRRCSGGSGRAKTFLGKPAPLPHTIVSPSPHPRRLHYGKPVLAPQVIQVLPDGTTLGINGNSIRSRE